MTSFFVFVSPDGEGPAQRVEVGAFGENDAVQKVARKNLGGTIFAVRSAYSTLPL